MGNGDCQALSVDEQIAHLISKGVTFKFTSEDEAKKYLTDNNYYFKLRAYRKNYLKHSGGEHVGKYICLDFFNLIDLAVIDMRLRFILLEMSLSIEHYAKLKLIHSVEKANYDACDIVDNYLSYLQRNDKTNGTQNYTQLQKELIRNKDNPYCSGIVTKYDPHYPIWAFLEIIPFGTMISFYKFCGQELKRSDIIDEHFLLKTVKMIRNASAHNNCIINDLISKDKKYKVNTSVSQSLQSLSKGTRRSQLSNERMRQITTMLYTHSVLVKSDGVRVHTKKNLDALVERMFKNITKYSGNHCLQSRFSFFKNIVDIYFKKV